MADNATIGSKPIKVGFFITCLVDLFRPCVGFASIKLLEDAGCTVEVPIQQTCCGQPAFNSGDRKTAQEIAKQVVDNFEDFDYIVTPSGSCAGTLKTHYPELLKKMPAYSQKVHDFSSKVYELTSFLVDVLNINSLAHEMNRNVTYHDSCAGLRELKIHKQPRQLLKSIKGLTINEMQDADVCCGFGGTFCIKYPDISNSIVQKKIEKIEDSGADTLLAGDLGCLMNMAGKLSKDNILSKQGGKIEVRHIAEVLADMTDEPSICQTHHKE